VTHTAIIRGNREFAHRLVDCAPVGSVIEVKAPRRTTDQNSLLWAMLSRISAAKPEGRALVPEVWKAVFMQALGHEQRFEMALDGKGFVPVGFRTSRMTKAQMADLITFIEEYAARHGVELERSE
jgi:NinB protein